MSQVEVLGGKTIRAQFAVVEGRREGATTLSPMDDGRVEEAVRVKVRMKSRPCR